MSYKNGERQWSVLISYKSTRNLFECRVEFSHKIATVWQFQVEFQQKYVQLTSCNGTYRLLRITSQTLLSWGKNIEIKVEVCWGMTLYAICYMTNARFISLSSKNSPWYMHKWFLVFKEWRWIWRSHDIKFSKGEAKHQVHVCVDVIIASLYMPALLSWEFMKV